MQRKLHRQIFKADVIQLTITQHAIAAANAVAKAKFSQDKSDENSKTLQHHIICIFNVATYGIHYVWRADRPFCRI